MKTLNLYITEGGFFKNINAEIVTPKNKNELIKIIRDTIEKEGLNCNLNFINTSKITDMSRLFEASNFDGDISEWDVHNVENMSSMFIGSKFNRDISNWHAEHTYTYNMFDDCHIKAEYKPKNIYDYKILKFLFQDFILLHILTYQ